MKLPSVLRHFLIALNVALILFYPYQTQSLPACQIRVLDEQRRPVEGAVVTQSWKDYSLESAADTHMESRSSDKDGHVEFPERTIRAGSLQRVIFTSLAALGTLAHGGYGVHAYLMVSAARKQSATINYKKGESWVKEIILQNW